MYFLPPYMYATKLGVFQEEALMRAEAPIGAGMESTNDARTGCEAGREQARSATLARELQRLVLTYAHSLTSAHAAPVSTRAMSLTNRGMG